MEVIANHVALDTGTVQMSDSGTGEQLQTQRISDLVDIKMENL